MMNTIDDYVQFIKQHHFPEKPKMPFTAQQPGQFIVLMAGAPDISPASVKQQHQNIIAANKHSDILILIETTQFGLILIDLTEDCAVASVPDRLRHFCPPWTEEVPRTAGSNLGRHHWPSELIAHIKDPLGINNKTPLIAVINPTENTLRDEQCPAGFDDWLIKPITEERLNGIIDLWQAKALTLNYIQSLLDKTKNNQRLTLTLFEKLFEELPSQILGIKNALKNKQYDLAKEITHKLHGSMSFCGLTDIQQPANSLESCLLNGTYANAHQHFLTLQERILNFMRLQDSILANLGKC